MEIAIGQAVEVCIGRMDEGAGQLIRAASNMNIRLNELDGCEGGGCGGIRQRQSDMRRRQRSEPLARTRRPLRPARRDFEADSGEG